MKKSDALKVVNTILALSFLLQLSTGLLHNPIPHELFEVIHQGGGIFLAACVVAHVVLNWSWVKISFFKKSGDKPLK
jgi:hypothetical protein